MNPFEFVLAILFMVFMFSLVKHKMGIRGDCAPASRQDEEEPAENARLRHTVKQLQDRIHVLERIVTDRGVETAAQIEALRDRERLDTGDRVL